MTMPSSGPLNMGGTSTPVSVAQELGLGLTSTISMNQTNVRTLAGVSTTSGTSWSMNSLYGKSNRVVSNITISANTQNYVLNTAKVAGYQAGNTDVTLTINSGIFVGSSTTGGIALDVATGWAAGDTLTIVNNGTIVGRGGAGGGGGFGVTGGSPGGSGGAALRVQRATSINNIGSIRGGGGGGGGGQGGQSFTKGDPGCAGGTGGSGYGFDGAGGGPTAGAAGGSSAYGAIGGNGGSGGAAGANGNPGVGGNGGGGNGGGGPAGNCTTTGSNALITWIATGTRNGTIG